MSHWYQLLCVFLQLLIAAAIDKVPLCFGCWRNVPRLNTRRLWIMLPCSCRGICNVWIWFSQLDGGWNGHCWPECGAPVLWDVTAALWNVNTLGGFALSGHQVCETLANPGELRTSRPQVQRRICIVGRFRQLFRWHSLWQLMCLHIYSCPCYTNSRIRFPPCCVTALLSRAIYHWNMGLESQSGEAVLLRVLILQLSFYLVPFVPYLLVPQMIYFHT